MYYTLSLKGFPLYCLVQNNKCFAFEMIRNLTAFFFSSVRYSLGNFEYISENIQDKKEFRIWVLGRTIVIAYTVIYFHLLYHTWDVTTLFNWNIGLLDFCRTCGQRVWLVLKLLTVAATCFKLQHLVRIFLIFYRYRKLFQISWYLYFWVQLSYSCAKTINILVYRMLIYMIKE